MQSVDTMRQFGMTAILNGLTLHGGFIAYGGTFLTFSDYARNAVRMAALSSHTSSCRSMAPARRCAGSSR